MWGSMTFSVSLAFLPEKASERNKKIILLSDQAMLGLFFYILSHSYQNFEVHTLTPNGALATCQIIDETRKQQTLHSSIW